jgi:hypothetical protein
LQRNNVQRKLRCPREDVRQLSEESEAAVEGAEPERG